MQMHGGEEAEPAVLWCPLEASTMQAAPAAVQCGALMVLPVLCCLEGRACGLLEARITWIPRIAAHCTMTVCHAIAEVAARMQTRGKQEAEPAVVWHPLEAPAAPPPPASDASSDASSDSEAQQPSAEQRRAERLRECRRTALYAAAKRAAAAREHAAAEEVGAQCSRV